VSSGRSLKTPDELASAGLLDAGQLEPIRALADRYAIALTPTVLALIDPDDPDDPIARQFVPDAAEMVMTPEERADPIGDAAHSPVKGLVHRYPDRVLLKAVHVCPVYCRFCFRREMIGPQGDGTLAADEFAEALGYIREHAEIWEVILTGGDPLILSPRRLGEMMRGLAAIEHVKIIRFHTRVPVVDPDRIDEARAACARLVDAGMPMVSQTVLLKGINYDPAVLGELMKAFVETRVKPYYLHHPDLAPGTGHFRMDIAEGQKIVAALRGTISGLCQPTYVLDIPGGHGKAPISASAVRHDGGCYMVSDFRGGEHEYPPR
jgi:lysine 2,3-aminomutase